MRTIVNRRGILVGIALLATAAVTACSANQTPGSAGSTDSQPTTPAAAAKVRPTATAATFPSAGTPSSTSAELGGIQNRVITGAAKSELTSAFLAYTGIPPSEVAGGGPVPGSVYYAYDPATDTDWAAANFLPVNTLPLSALESFDSAGDIGMFRQVGTGAWQVLTGASSLRCLAPHFFPQAVLIAWSLPTSPSCMD